MTRTLEVGELVDVHDQTLAVLAGPDRLRYLAILADHVTLRARGEYLEAGHNDEARALAALRALNEVMIVVAKQLKSSMTGKPAYPDGAFLEVILEQGAIGGSEGAVRDALAYAMKEFQGQWP
jgi:hypothetical protein